MTAVTAAGRLFSSAGPGGTAALRRGAPGVRRAGLVLCALTLLLLTAGCHKRVQSSGSTYPPAPPLTREGSGRSSGGTVRRTTPAVPRFPATIDNGEATVAIGRVDTGVASWYAPSGQRSSNGEVYDGNAMTAAHRTLPLGTLVRVTNLATNQSVVVRITDRGPFVPGRVLDLSIAAAKAAGVYRMGVAQVTLEVLQVRAGASATGRWCVQIGAFTQDGNADRLRAELARQYSGTARVIEFQGATGMWVRINPLAGGSRPTALAMARSIRTGEPDAQAYLVRLD